MRVTFHRRAAQEWVASISEEEKDYIAGMVAKVVREVARVRWRTYPRKESKGLEPTGAVYDPAAAAWVEQTNDERQAS